MSLEDNAIKYPFNGKEHEAATWNHDLKLALSRSLSVAVLDALEHLQLLGCFTTTQLLVAHQLYASKIPLQKFAACDHRARDGFDPNISAHWTSTSSSRLLDRRRCELRPPPMPTLGQAKIYRTPLSHAAFTFARSLPALSLQARPTGLPW